MDLFYNIGIENKYFEFLNGVLVTENTKGENLMLMINFLDKKEFSGSGYMKCLCSFDTYKETKDGDDCFKEISCEYDAENNRLVFTECEEGEESNSVVTNLFYCDKERIEKVNKAPRDVSEDIIVMCDRVRFVAGVPCLFRVVPFGDAVAVCLHAGAMEFYVGGEWIPMSRRGGFDDSAKRCEMSSDSLCNLVRMTDKETGLDISKEGSNLCEVSYVMSKTGEYSLKCKCIADGYILINEEKVAKERFDAKRERNRKRLEAEQKKLENEAFRQEYEERERRKEEEFAERKKKNKEYVKKRREAKPSLAVNVGSVSDDSNPFLDALRRNGYKG